MEWFTTLNRYLVDFESEIIPVTILEPFRFSIKLEEHVNHSTFYRYFISDIPEERILYLDSDIIVDGNIEEMYFSEFHGKFAKAVKDMYVSDVEHWYQEYPNMKPYFNAGVILVNNTLWKINNLKESLIQTTIKYPKLSIADQDVLNIVFKR